MKLKFAIIVSSLLVSQVACMNSKRTNQLKDEALTQKSDIPPVIVTMADWIRVKRAMIEVYREHLATLQNIDQIIHNRAVLSGQGEKVDSSQTLNLAGDLNLVGGADLDYEAKKLQNQGEAISNYAAALNANSSYAMQMAQIQQMYANMSNAGFDSYLKGQKSQFEMERMGIDNDGARISNFGKMLENNSKALDNQLKSLEVVLKGMYSTAYGSYVNAYAEYSEQIQNVWQSVGRVNREANAALGQLKQYRRQVSICEARRKKIDTLNHRAALEELQRKVSLSTLPKIMRRFAASVEGESCLHKVLLSANYRNISELNFINYDVKFDDEPVGRFCPKAAAADLQNIPVADYPPPAIDPKTLEVVGFYQPMTYYQVFRLIVDRSEDVEIGDPKVSSSKEMCKSAEARPYLLKSLEAEKALAETYSVVMPSAVTDPHGFSTDYGSISANETKYRLFLERMTNLMRLTQECVLDQRQLADAVGQVDGAQPAAAAAVATPEKPASSLLPLEAKKAAFSDYNIFMDNSFPLMSASVRECMNMAEHHRYRVFAQMDADGAILEILERATKMSPPRSPHPIQFQPANGPLARPGNDN